jgi:acyl transferase domain-containing protein
MQDLPGGSMLAVRRVAAELEGSLPEGVAVAAINSPFLTTLSGPTPTLLDLQKTFEAAGVFCRLLPTSHAFHSSMMDPIVERFTELAGSVRQQKPTLPWISTFTGTWIVEQATLGGSYWAGQLRRTVRFSQAVETAIKNDTITFLEVGPGQALTQLVLQQPSNQNGRTALTSLGPCDETPTDVESMLTSLGRLWLSGIEPDWPGFYSAEKRKRVALPTYPFERKSYWIAPPARGKQVPVPSISKGAERNDNGNGTGPTASPEVSPFVGHAVPSPTPQPMVAAATQSNTCRVIEQQVQLMAQQLETLRKRTVRGKSNHGKQ